MYVCARACVAVNVFECECECVLTCVYYKKSDFYIVQLYWKDGGLHAVKPSNIVVINFPKTAEKYFHTRTCRYELQKKKLKFYAENSL